MNEMEFSNKSIELAMDFIKSVEERMIELKNNPELLRKVIDKQEGVYHDNQEVKVLTAERFLTLCLKDGRIISIRELKNEQFPVDKEKTETDRAVEIFKEINRLLLEGETDIRKGMDLRMVNKQPVKSVSGEYKEIVFDSPIRILYLQMNRIFYELQHSSLDIEGMSQPMLIACLSKSPAFVGYVKAHKFGDVVSSCMAFNDDMLPQYCEAKLTGRFEELKSITYDSDSE